MQIAGLGCLMAHIETKNVADFITGISSTFGIENTKLVDSPEAHSIFLDTGVQNMNTMVGRYCKHTGLGVIMDRRDHEINVQRTSEVPSRRKNDAKSSGNSYIRGEDCSPDVLW